MGVQVCYGSYRTRRSDAHIENCWHVLEMTKGSHMTRFDKLKLFLLGKDHEEVSWLFYFILSSVVSGVIGIIAKVIRLF
jgi:hypothetical protein